MTLNHFKKRFVVELLGQATRDATAAYCAVYNITNRRSAATSACRLLQDPEVIELIRIAEEGRARRVEMTADDVLKQVFQIANTDINEIIEWRVGACRYCYGENHLYQRRPSEMAKDLQLYLRSHQTSDPHGIKFDLQGGIGYNANREPHPECPECDGVGVGREVAKDSRKLSPAAKLLYNGVRKGKNGSFEILTRTRDKALDLAARNTGVSKENVSVSGNVDGGVTIYVPDNGRDPPPQSE